MEIGVAAYLKKINKSLVLSKIIKHELISRAELANITKLTKAKISSQAAELFTNYVTFTGGVFIYTKIKESPIFKGPIVV
ncbi:hypothetical protein QF028_003447 [Neobacillus sp. B4I6]|jgi:hypothetical protein|uniref:hypothetical protein n=1 Tax=Neobacillus sp. B4I6 TaxID=3373925 RepID=UPI003D1BF1DF